MVRRASLVMLAAVSLLIVLSTMTRAAGENHAAIVVAFGDGSYASRCVSFSEPEVTGFELLQRSGLSVVVEDQAAGSAVCSIDNTGCPADDCFCQCRGGDCLYWSYWHLLNGSWNYSAAGSSIYRIADGSVDGWAWGPGSVTQAIPPPSVSFDEVCAVEATATVTLTPSVTPTPLLVASLAAETPSGSSIVPTVRPTATVVGGGAPVTAAPTAAVDPEETVPSPTSLATPDNEPSTAEPLPPAVAVEPPALTSPASAAVLSATDPNAVISPDATTAGPAELAYPGVAGGGGAPPEPVAALGQADIPVPTVEIDVAMAAEVTAVAVVGAGVLPESEPAAAVAPTSAGNEQPKWLPYVGLVAMLLGLGALMLIARSRGAGKDRHQ